MAIDTRSHATQPFIVNGLVATGNSQATALPLANNTNHEFATVAASTGAVLPAPEFPSEISVFNNGANSLSVYPPPGGTINNGTVNTPITVSPSAGTSFWGSSATNWNVIQTAAAGGSGSPGGASGQIQYGNAGVFAGFTASGDATINTSTGAVTVTKTSGVAFATSATTDTTSATNITSGALPAARIAANSLALSKLATGTANSLVGFDGSGNPADVTITTTGSSGAATLSGGVLNIPQYSGGGGGGTVTSVSVVSTNGFTGTVANATTTPAITLTTSITGILKGNGTAISAAVSDTDYQAPITLTTTGSSGAATFSGNTLNVPQYTGGGGSGTVNSGTSGQVAYYAGTGTAVSGEGLSALIDSAIGATQGDILYRGASTWSVLAPGTTGQILASQGASANPHWITASGSGTVTSIAMTGDGTVFDLIVGGSPITTSGTLIPALLTQTANTIFAGPTSGSAATPTFRAPVAADFNAGTTAAGYLVSNGSGTLSVGGPTRLTLTGSGNLASSQLPANCTFLRVYMMGGGGGGGGGTVAASAAGSIGGAGGAGAARLDGTFLISDLTGSFPIAYSVGAGGTAGAAGVITGGAGGNGGNGGNTTFGSLLTAAGGGGGAASGASNTAIGLGQYGGGTGGSSTVASGGGGGLGNSGSSNTTGGGAGGGGGGSVDTSGTLHRGQNGGTPYGPSYSVISFGTSGPSAAGGAGGAGGPANSPFPGCGGGGGSGNTAGAGFAGGAGGAYGGGGGGGGGAITSTGAGGAGGVGGAGCLILEAW